MENNIVPFEEGNFEDSEVIVGKVTVQYIQNDDSSGEDHDGSDGAQELTLTARSNGLARFINIKTESWSINDIDDLEKVIKDFKVRASLK